MHWHWPDLHGDCYASIFTNLQHGYGPWLLSKLFFHSISCEQIDGIGSDFACALSLTRSRLGLLQVNFANIQQFWPLAVFDLLFPLKILWTNWWNLIKFCTCIYLDQIYVGIVMRQFFTNIQHSYGCWLLKNFISVPYDKSLIAEKVCAWLCHQQNSFSFDQIFLKLADKVDMDRISDKFKTWPDCIIYLRVTSPWLLKKLIFDFIISITSSILIGSSWNLQIRWTWMKSCTKLKTVQIRLFILEFRPLDSENAYFWPCYQHNSFNF